MSEYVCPGCRANDMADECWHTPRMWSLAEALAEGLPGGPATWGTPVDRAWQFIDDAEGLDGDVGEPPYQVVCFHPEKPEPYTTIGLINGRYLWAMPNDEGDVTAELIGDCGDRVTIRTDERESGG
ncbi:hypothetical protein OR221_0812 [Microbacterium laevaniformans OR221]|nr:hypothetical protein OR221_0812 [Microbacterium laevaniformans OR221]